VSFVWTFNNVSTAVANEAQDVYGPVFPGIFFGNENLYFNITM